VVVYSQFLGMIEIMKSICAQGIGFVTLTGKVGIAGIVSRFNEI
jgi:hypothetical protein